MKKKDIIVLKRMVKDLSKSTGRRMIVSMRPDQLEYIHANVLGNEKEGDLYAVANSADCIRNLRNSVSNYLVFVPNNVSYYSELGTHLHHN